MTRHTDLTFHPLTLQDTPAWSALIRALAAADGTGETYEPDDLAEELVSAGVDASADTWGVRDGRTLVAYGQVHVSTALTAEGLARAHLGGGVHPRWRGRGIATALFERMEARALGIAGRRHPGAAVQLSASGGVDGADARTFLAGRGYAPARWFTDMTRPLPGPPLGPALRPADGRAEPYEDTMAEELRLAHNDAFSTHWGSTERSPEAWADLVGARSARTDLWRVVREPGGRILAYCSVSQWREGALYVDRVGTRQEARGRGLARAVLLDTVAAAAADGAWTTMELTVDAANPTRADALYRSVGFVPVRTQAAFARTVPPGA